MRLAKRLLFDAGCAGNEVDQRSVRRGGGRKAETPPPPSCRPARAAANIAPATGSQRPRAVSLYELVLRWPDSEEVRLTDQPLAVGDTFQIGYDEWVALAEAPAENPRATARLMCERAKAQRALAAKMQADDAARRRRIVALESRRTNT